MTTEQWHVKKEVNLAHVITTLSLVVGCFWFFSDMDKRINANTISISYVQDQREEDRKRVEKQLDKINSKLDRLLEKQ